MSNKNGASDARTWRNRPSYRLREAFPAPPELQDVVCRANKLPFGARSADAPQKELPQAAFFLDIPEDGLHRGTSIAVHFLPALRQQFAFHALLRRQVLRDAPSRGGARAALFLFVFVGDGDEKFGLTAFKSFK